MSPAPPQAAELREQIERLQRQLRKVEMYGEEPPVGTMIRFVLRFSKSGKKYTYLAVRVDDHWYTTAAGERAVRAWDELLDWWSEVWFESLAILTVDGPWPRPHVEPKALAEAPF